MKAGPGLRSLLALSTLLLAFPPAAAQYEAEYEDDGIRQAVARISWFEGEVSFNRGDDPDDWQLASVNYPVTVGDRLWASSNARLELQLPGATLYLGPESELGALDLTRDARQLSLSLGTVTLRIRRLDRDEAFELATPNVSVTFVTPGVYRIDVDEDGNTRASVYSGRAWAAAAGGQVGLQAGDQIRVWGLDRPDYDVVGLSRSDSWDRWVDNRARRLRTVRPTSYVHPDIYGAEELDAYGSWQNVPEYGPVWFPAVTASGWQPYRLGRWIWRDPWGWTWVSSEPWGWAPYHYGRWSVVRGRWCWVPVGPRSPYPSYAPALVGFVGGGPGWSVSFSGGGYVGWFPLGPREPFVPWWYRPRHTRHVNDYAFVHRGRATVVPRDVFAGGRHVDRDVVRSPGIVRDVSRAPVLSGPIPVLPTRDSIRVREVGVQGRAPTRPPEGIGRREVVTRAAPPPPPPTFDRKLEVIRESGGEPVPVEVARRLSVDEHGGGRGTQPVRPAGRAEVLLSPRGDVEASRLPQALPPIVDRPDVPVEPAFPRRDDVRPTPAPEFPREGRPERPTAEPRKGWQEDTWPTRAAWTPRPEWREPTRPPVRTFERPTPVPTPRSEVIPAPMPRVERTEPPRSPEPTAIRYRAPRPEPQVDVPRRGEIRGQDEARPARAEPERIEAKPTTPPRTSPKETPVPTKAPQRREVKVEPERDRG